MAENERIRKLGQSIACRRETLNISQEELAARSGYSQTYLSQVENGKRNPSMKMLCAVADGLGCPVYTFIDF